MINEIYIIEWIDSYSISEGWELIKDIEDIEDVICYSIGYILKETDSNILIASHISDINNIDSLGAYRGALVIPKIAIISKKVLKVSI